MQSLEFRNMSKRQRGMVLDQILKPILNKATVDYLNNSTTNRVKEFLSYYQQCLDGKITLVPYHLVHLLRQVVWELRWRRA